MMKIPDKIRTFVINLFIRQCQVLHSIAYFEYRGEQNPEKAKDVEPMLLYRKYKLTKQAEDFATFVEDYKNTELGLQQFEYELPPQKLQQFCKHYGEPNVHMINSLSMIGLADLQGPKEAEGLSTTEKEHIPVDAQEIEYLHHAYPSYKYQTGYPPSCMFKPTDEVLLKLLRAATFVKNEEDFVFNKKNIEHMWFD